MYGPLPSRPIPLLDFSVYNRLKADFSISEIKGAGRVGPTGYAALSRPGFHFGACFHLPVCPFQMRFFNKTRQLDPQNTQVARRGLGRYSVHSPGAGGRGQMKKPNYEARLESGIPTLYKISHELMLVIVYSLRNVERRPVLCSFKRIEGGLSKKSLKKNPSTSSTRPRLHCPASVCLALAIILACLASL